MSKHYMLGFGSLVAEKHHSKYSTDSFKPIHVWVRDYKLVWNISMENKVTIPNYKYYIDKETGERLDVYVTALNVEYAEGEKLLGVVFEVEDEMLKEIDNREQKYNRIDFSEFIDENLEAPIWGYIAKDESLDIYRKGKSEGKLAIAKPYFDLVHTAFESVSKEYAENFKMLTENTGIPFENIKIVRT